ncbi:MAG: hypothetical protein ACMXYB_00955 [Candidatus Woesearchaeota archaeon]
MGLLLSLFYNLKLVFSNYRYGVLFVILNTLILYFFSTQMADELIKVNYGIIYYNLVWVLQILISVLLSLFILLTAFRVSYFSTTSLTQNGIGGLSSTLGILVAGCPACSITIASYLGLASFISFLPYDGLELKLLSFILLLIVNFYLLKDLQVCKFKKNPKKVIL